MLTLADRVAYQRAIEEVYWRHRIWPKEPPDPKPSLDEVMPSAQLEKKVEDYLRNSQALEDYWQRPLSAEQLQAEMERMARHTRQPEVIRELFAALGNDPYVIAECLARPALSERLLTSFYAHDQRFHGVLRQRAEAELRGHPSVRQMKETSGKYSEIELVRSDSAQDEENRDAERGLRLNRREWDESVQQVAATFSKPNAVTPKAFGVESVDISAQYKSAPADLYETIPTGKIGSLREDNESYYATAVLKKSKDHMKLATVQWRKQPLESWRAKAENQVPKEMAAVVANYTLPTISDGTTGCTDDSWTATAGPPSPRYYHTAVWTGTEIIVWGGVVMNNNYLNTGGRYNPSTDNWIATSTTNAPSGRSGHTAVWTGVEMVVWGGGNGNNFLNAGGKYNPTTDTWTATSVTNAPSARAGHSSIWTGTEMIIWGGYDGSNDLNTGGRYNPGTNSWIPTSLTNAPSARGGHTSIWSGSEMIIWGGYDGNNYLNTGARYNPGTNSWIATGTTNAPAGRGLHTAVWTGSEMIVWGGNPGFGTDFNTGGRYNPGTNSWTATSTTNAPDARHSHTAVWTGSEMIVWGGLASFQVVNTGARYNPGSDSWTATSTTNAPSARELHTAVWTGSEMIIWGGEFPETDTGGRYNPSTNSWIRTAGPDARQGHKAVWTGSEMIIWGGLGNSNVLNSGGRYNPSTDSWTATSTINAPDARSGHSAVWSGSEMIVWGGEDQNFAPLNTGGRYNPTTDSWTATSTNNAPSARGSHTAVWTGNEMIIWGGNAGFNLFNTGGRYSPAGDVWIAITTTNAPPGRTAHTAVWTGSEMIVWGGEANSGDVNTGGRYNPITDSWTATSTTNAPDARYSQTAVWTSSEMIIWGGDENFGYSNTGGRYNPGADSWEATSTTNAPEARTSHTAVWTGSQMIVWGGFNSNSGYLNTGGRYNPGMDSWMATSLVNAPVTRDLHTAVWTGSEMIVWGGSNGGPPFDTGWRYCAPASVPAQLGNISTRAFVQTGDNVMIGGLIITGSGQKRVIVRAIGPSLAQYGITNPLLDPTLELHDHTGAVIAFNDNWMDAPNRQEIIDSGLAPSNNLESAILTSLDPGAYTAIARGINNGTGIALVEGYDLDPAAGSKLGNISTRALVQTGDNVMIGGLIITGTGQENVIVRAIGPSLAQYGITNPLADPTLELHDGNGAVIAFNDNWRDSQEAEIQATGLAPSNDLESAIVATLAPGSYTAIVRGKNDTIGVALVEMYGLN
jgi:N-acetylneuraminic acid mutarotase